MSDHATYSPSAAHRNINCLAAVAISLEAEKQKKVPPPSEYAKEGTIYHNYLSEYLKKPYSDSVEGASDEMIGHLQDEYHFTNELRKNFLKKFPKAREFIEQRVTYNEHFWGTADYMLVGANNGETSLLLKDTKYGRGVPVKAEENYQMLCYAICAEKSLNIKVDTFHLFIYQPRVGDTAFTRWTIKRPEYLEYKQKIIANLEEHLNNVASRSFPYTPGDHCRFCPGRLICDGLRDYQNSSALKILNEIPEVPTLAALSIEQKIEIRKLRKTIEQLLDDIDSDLHTRAVQGESLPGLKLVNGVSRRQWKGDVGNELAALGVTDPYEKKLKGITAVEKEIGKGKIDDLVVFSNPSTLLVPESDKREEVSVMTIADIEEVNI